MKDVYDQAEMKIAGFNWGWGGCFLYCGSGWAGVWVCCLGWPKTWSGLIHQSFCLHEP